MLTKEYFEKKIDELNSSMKIVEDARKKLSSESGSTIADIEKVCELPSEFSSLLEGYYRAFIVIHEQIFDLNKMHNKKYKKGEKNMKFKITLDDAEPDRVVSYMESFSNLFGKVSDLTIVDEDKKRLKKVRNLYTKAIYYQIRGIHKFWVNLFRILALKEIDTIILDNVYKASSEFRKCSETIARLNRILEQGTYDRVQISEHS